MCGGVAFGQPRCFPSLADPVGVLSGSRARPFAKYGGAVMDKTVEDVALTGL